MQIDDPIVDGNPSTGAAALQRFGPDPHAKPDDDEFCDFWGSACREMLKEEAAWQQRGNSFAWIDEKPTWVSAAAWDDYLGDGFPPAPNKANAARHPLLTDRRRSNSRDGKMD